MVDLKQLWDSALVDIELQVSKPNFSTWFRNTAIVKHDEGTIYLGVPNEFVRDWLVNKYHKFILKILREKNEYIRAIEYLITKEEYKKKQLERAEQMFMPSAELPLNEYYINKDDNLNPRYTFDNFVVGPFNELAYAAAQAIVKKPGIVYNPLFIYGDTGRGKTHLIQAVGNYLKAAHSSKRVYYVTSEKFAIDYVNALQNNKPNSFKEKYRSYDVLIMDDIQFLADKNKSQEELFHLFNTLYDNNKQIVFSSDKHVNYIPNLEERLKSRFSAGMIVDIPAPDKESRLAIIKTKAEQNNIPLTMECMEYIAFTVEGNIRDLEGILNTISMQTQLKNKPLGLQEVKNLIKNNVKPKKSLSVKEVIKIVSDFYNIEENGIYEKSRRKEVVKPRQIIMYLLREDFSISYPTIGQKLGGRDHTTVIHSCEKIKNDLKNSSILVQEMSKIRSLF